MNQKTIKFLKNLSTGMVVIAIVFAFLIAGIRIFGFEVFGVLTGSMEPTYPTGSLIYVKDVDPEDLRVNDVITFSISPNVIATHRIVEIVPDEQYPTIVRFRTKGDANKDVDASLVSSGNIIGKAMFAIPQMGYFANYIQQPPGIYVAILVCGLMIAFVFYTDSLDNKQKQAEGQMQPLPEEKKGFDLIALINKASIKLLKRPLIEQKQQEESLNQGYTPGAQPQQMNAYPPQQQYYYGAQGMYQQPMQGYPQQNYPQQPGYPQQPYYQQPMQGYPQNGQPMQPNQQMYAQQPMQYPQYQQYPQQYQQTGPYYPQNVQQPYMQAGQPVYPPQNNYPQQPTQQG